MKEIEGHDAASLVNGTCSDKRHTLQRTSSARKQQKFPRMVFATWYVLTGLLQKLQRDDVLGSILVGEGLEFLVHSGGGGSVSEYRNNGSSQGEEHKHAGGSGS